MERVHQYQRYISTRVSTLDGGKHGFGVPLGRTETLTLLPRSYDSFPSIVVRSSFNVMTSGVLVLIFESCPTSGPNLCSTLD